jgi:pyruvate dehydrogenase E2 component (dihydrolipoamide acetyltransferase)
MDEGTFGEWLKKEGEKVHSGDMLFILEGDKASQEIESFDEGILRMLPDAPKPGATVTVGQLLGYLVEEGEEAPFEAAGAAAQADVHAVVAKSTAAAPAAPALAASVPASARRSNGRPTSPRARRVARELGLDPSRVTGTGRGGRVVERDVRAAAFGGAAGIAAAPPPASRTVGQTIPITVIRRTIAERMLAGVHEAAPVTLTTKANATNLVSLRAQYKATDFGDSTPSYTDLIIALTGTALVDHPMLAARWTDDAIVVPEHINIAFAVDTENGLLAPVIRDVPCKRVRQIATEARQLITAARAGQVSPEQMRDGCFTVSNLGGFGIDAFTPIINLPQCAILGVGRISKEPVVVDEKILAQDTVVLSLTFDHRVVDGAPAARFLDQLRRRIEQPSPWLIA